MYNSQKLHLIGIICLHLLYSACNFKEASTQVDIADYQIEQIEVSSNTKREMPLSEFIQSISYVYLETKPESLIGEVSKVEISNGLYFIMDNNYTQSLTVFDSLGKFLYRLQQGRGKGEFADIDDFSIDESGGVLYILDTTGKRIHRYQMNDGQYLSSVPIIDYYQKMQILSDGNILLLRDGNSYESSPPPYQYNLICRIDSTGKWDKGWRLEPINPYLNVGDIVIASGSNKGQLITRQFSDTIYRYHDNEVSAAYLLDFKDNPLPPEFYFTNQQSFLTDKFFQNYTFFSGKALEIKDFLFVEYIAAAAYNYFIYDEVSKTGNTITWVNDIDGIPIFAFNLVHDNQLVRVLSSMEIDMLQQSNIDSSEKLKEIASHVNFDSNPVLMKLTLK